MDGDLLTFTLLSLSSIIVVVNPLTAMFSFVSLTTHLTREEKGSVVKDATRYALFILIGFALLGGMILQLFGISLEAFRIAGGILLFGIGMEMVQARTPRTKLTDAEKSESSPAEDIMITPLAFPIISGPGALTTAIVLMNEAQGSPAKIAVIMASILIAILLTWFTMIRADDIVKRIGARENRALNRLMGVLLIAIAVQFVINGIRIAFPAVGGG